MVLKWFVETLYSLYEHVCHFGWDVIIDDVITYFGGIP